MPGFKIADAWVEVTTQDRTEAGSRRIVDRLNRLRGTANVDVRVDTVSIGQARTVVLRSGRDMERSFSKTVVAARALSRVSGYALVGAGGLTVLAGAAGIAGAALAALPAMVGAAAGVGGVLVGAFSGVGEALKGYKADQDAAAKAGARTAASEISNARQIRDAQQSIADARRNQARVAQDAAEAIADAQRDEARAARDGAEAIAAASRRVRDALDDEQDAQEDLTAARVEAARRLDDLRERVSDFALDQEGAAIRVAEAEAGLAEVMANSTATALDRRKAEYELATARERVSDLTREQAESTAALTDAERRGVDGSELVISAQDRVQEAHRSVEDSQRDLARTQRDAAETQADAARRVQEAVENSAVAQEDAARAVASALQGLTDAQTQQAASADVAAVASSKYAEAMAKLSPSGRAFVEQLIAMKPLVTGLRDEAQGSYLPGLTQMFKDSEGLFPIFQGHIRATGTIMGDTSHQFGQMFKSDEFKANLDATFKNSLPIVSAFSAGVLLLTERWFALGADSGPVTAALATGVTALFVGLSGFLDALEPHMESFGELLGNVLSTLGIFLPILGTTLGVMAEMFNLLGPAIGPVLAGLIGLLIASKVATAIGAVTVAFNLMKIAFAANPIGIILIGLSGLVAALIYAYSTSETFRNIVDGALRAVGNAAMWLWNNAIKPSVDFIVGYWRMLGNTGIWLWQNMLLPAFNGIGAAANFLWNNVIRPVSDFIVGGFRNIGSGATWLWQNIIVPSFNGIGNVIRFTWDSFIRPAFDAMRHGVDLVGRGFQGTVDWIARAWASLRDAVRHPINGVIDIWNRVNDIWRGEDIRHFATGGKVPGQGTRDTVPAMLTPGEFVVRKGIAAENARLLEDLNSGRVVEGAGHDGPGAVRTGFGGVRPHVAMAGHFLRNMFGVATVGGVGSRPNASDHPRGLALDFMTYADIGKGQRLADYAVANARHLAVKYVIFNRRINSGGGWSGMADRGSPTANHLDHPHISFLDGPGGGRDFAGGGGGFLAGLAKAAIELALRPFNAVLEPLIRQPDVVRGAPGGIFRALKDNAVEKALSFVGFGGSGGGAAGGGAAGGGGSHTGPVVDQVRAVASRFGWGGGSEWDALSALIQKESSWNPAAANPTSSARGLFQKMTSIHGPVEPTAGGQAEWGLNYIRNRYGSPSAAWSFHRRNNFYDKGGLLPPGMSTVHNNTGRPERVLNADQTDRLDQLLGRRDGGVVVNVIQQSGSPAETGRFVALALRTVG